MTLTTDWGDRDFFAGMVKGTLCSLIPNVRVVDISHSQDNNDSRTTAETVRLACSRFPKGTVHIIDVGSDLGREPAVDPVAVAYRDMFFLSLSVKVLEMAFDEEPSRALRLAVPATLPSLSFLALDLFCPLAASITERSGIDWLTGAGFELKPVKRLMFQSDENTIHAMVTNVDKYGNAILNVPYESFERLRAGRSFSFEVGGGLGPDGRSERLASLTRHYSEVRRGNMLLTVSASGYLQLALNQASAAQLMALSPMTACTIVFH